MGGRRLSEVPAGRAEALQRGESRRNEPGHCSVADPDGTGEGGKVEVKIENTGIIEYMST